MKKYTILPILSTSILFSQLVLAAPCTFDASKTCTVKTDILNDKTSSELNYFAPTNYNHQVSGEINVYNVSMYKKNTDGSITLSAQKNKDGSWISGEIMTRANLTSPPFNSPTPSQAWTTASTTHGYLEVVAKLPSCTPVTGNSCRGLWPAIWMEPTYDDNWPQNGEIDIMEAYPRDNDNNPLLNVTTSALHFNGNSSQCGGPQQDCKNWGLSLEQHTFPALVANDYHTWGFEWEKNAQSTTGGYIINGYIDNVKVWSKVTDNLPADGPGALQRGFNDPNGGYYLIVNLAIGGPYAGAPDTPLTSASMNVKSIKVYQVNGSTPVTPCSPPANINGTWTPDMKNVTLTWTAPTDGTAVKSYQVKDYTKKVMSTTTSLSFTDKSLPGQAGKFTYYLSTVCANGSSADVQYDVNITPSAQCNPPTNITPTYTPDRKSITLTWTAPSGSTVQNYQVRDWQQNVLWTGNQLKFTDSTLPGRPGMFTYFLSSICSGKSSSLVQKDVFIN